jgi:putative transposase
MEGHRGPVEGMSGQDSAASRQTRRSFAVLCVMTRIPRLVVPGLAHHVTQRGNRRQPTFFRAFDYEVYRQLLAAQCEKESVSVWTYCLLPNHVHLIAVPETPESLARAVGEAHRQYTTIVNKREGWKGCLWQGRFASYAMDEPHLYAAARYVLMNPVRAGLADRAADWPFSSTRAHLGLDTDELVDVDGLARFISDWNDLLSESPSWSERSRLRRHENSGVPLGDEKFLGEVAAATGRDLRSIAAASRRDLLNRFQRSARNR